MTKSARKLVVTKLSSNFREAVEVKEFSLEEQQKELGPTEVLVKVHHVGINATDINFSAGRYDPTSKPPFDAGFEYLGVVYAKGSDVKLNVGQAVMAIEKGAFAEYVKASEKTLIPIPTADPKYLVCLVSGLTAYLSLDQIVINQGEKVLVTAAAGGLGQIVVQYAKSKGAFVIGTCSSEDKSHFLKQIGCDHVINYKRQDLKSVLKSEYPNGVDVVYETIGGEVFRTLLNALAVRGRLVVIGSIVHYNSDGGSDMNSVFPDQVQTGYLLSKSVTVSGFFLNHYWKEIPAALTRLITDVSKDELKAKVDIVQSDAKSGIESIYDAVDYLHSGRSIGKVVCAVSDETRQKL